jgi:hypothetical protein
MAARMAARVPKAQFDSVVNDESGTIDGQQVKETSQWPSASSHPDRSEWCGADLHLPYTAYMPHSWKSCA